MINWRRSSTRFYSYYNDPLFATIRIIDYKDRAKALFIPLDMKQSPFYIFYDSVEEAMADVESVLGAS